eukprot:2434190-Lingulodinium_polyedra.AAC.1
MARSSSRATLTYAGNEKQPRERGTAGRKQIVKPSPQTQPLEKNGWRIPAAWRNTNNNGEYARAPQHKLNTGRTTLRGKPYAQFNIRKEPRTNTFDLSTNHNKHTDMLGRIHVTDET